MNNKSVLVYLFIFQFLCAFSVAHAHAITYETPGGRFGDQLIAYMHAKWLSYHYDIPLFCKPFQYCDELMLSEKELFYSEALIAPFQHIVKIESLKTLEENTKSDVLFFSQYFPESAYELKSQKWPAFPVDWEDSGFISLLRALIYPKNPISYPPLPHGKVSIAAHIRRGGGFDDPALQTHWPLKFPPDSFYIEQIRHIYEKVDHAPLFVYLFTDDPCPSAIAETYRQALSDIDVVFGYRMGDNSYKTHVLEDLFDMARYECLIRPESNYSIVAEKLGNFKILIHPLQGEIKNKQILITEVNTIENSISH